MEELFSRYNACHCIAFISSVHRVHLHEHELVHWAWGTQVRHLRPRHSLERHVLNTKRNTRANERGWRACSVAELGGQTELS